MSSQQDKLDKSHPDKVCTSPYHAPPMHIFVPPGQSFSHVCPACGYKTTVKTSVTW